MHPDHEEHYTALADLNTVGKYYSNYVPTEQMSDAHM